MIFLRNLETSESVVRSFAQILGFSGIFPSYWKLKLHFSEPATELPSPNYNRILDTVSIHDIVIVI